MAALHSKQSIRDIIVRYGELVREQIDVKHVYLYGSYAKGNHSIDSDIDLAVVGDDFSGDLVDDTLLLMRLRRKIDYRIEPRPFKSCDFNMANPLVREIITNGVKVM